ncbi:MFS transporter [Chloroflexota bacterium]
MLYILLGKQASAKKAEKRITGNLADTPHSPHSQRHLVSFLVLGIIVAALMHSMRGFIPLYAVDYFGVSEETAAALMALFPIAGFWAAPLGGYLSDRVGRIPVMLIACFLSGLMVYSLNIVSYGLAFSAMLVFIGTLDTIRMPTAEAYISVNTSEQRRSTMLGIYYFSGREVGGLLTSAMGYLIDRIGFHSSFTIISISIVVVTLVSSVFLLGKQDKAY